MMPLEGTPAQVMRAAARQLELADIPDPSGDARRLLAAALGVEPGRLTLRETRLTPDERALFDAYLSRRLSRQPVSQITGRRAFWRHSFRVTPDVLDPRPETETLIDAALRLPWRTVLDLGTGSGAILISLLAARPGTRGTGTDLSPAALALAQENAATIGVSAGFLESDWFAAVEGRFDLIASNPPYIALDEMPGLDPDVRDWEPRMALTDEGDGLVAYRAICAGALAHLTPGGALMVEIGPTQGQAVAGLMAAAGLAEIRILPDLDGRDRVVCGRAPAG